VGVAQLVEGDFGDADVLDGLLAGGDVDAVVHMAGSCSVGESMTDPADYYENNVVRTLELLDAMRRHGVQTFVFSSSAAVYGEPQDVPIKEEHRCEPTNPYGETKLAIEKVLGWYHRAYGLRYAALRYFNAAGAHPSSEIGEDHGEHETHLIPRLIRSAMVGGRRHRSWERTTRPPTARASGTTCHVVDLAQAHAQALGAIDRGTLDAGVFNLGNGEGFSVREVVAAVAEATAPCLPSNGPRAAPATPRSSSPPPSALSGASDGNPSIPSFGHRPERLGLAPDAPGRLRGPLTPSGCPPPVQALRFARISTFTARGG
jgi:UDP-glucose 4-epimerase